MKKNLMYCISMAVLSVAFMIADQSNAQAECLVTVEESGKPDLDIVCGPL